MSIHITPQCPFCKNPLEGWTQPPIPALWSSNKHWQKCPVCYGTGTVTNMSLTSATGMMCPACKGACMVQTP